MNIQTSNHPLSISNRSSEAPPKDPAQLAAWIETQFANAPGCDRITIPMGAEGRSKTMPRYAVPEGGNWVVHRTGFLQSAEPWLRHAPATCVSSDLVPGPEGRDHPLRPRNPNGLVYERYFKDADVTVSFWTVDIDRDLDMFHRWQNDPRVAYFWEEDKSKEALREFLEDRQADPHNLSLVGAYDDQPVGYFEVYWAREDRLGAYYDAGPWDRGWHGLIGEAQHLGRRKTSAWIRALSHYIFLDCPKTDVIVGEPRVDNAKLLRYADAMAYEKVKEFDFPHKRSALMRCRRDAFFAKVPL